MADLITPTSGPGSFERAYEISNNEQFCVFCGGDPDARCREGTITSAGLRLAFMGNMAEDQALALGYRVSGRVKAPGSESLFHAYEEEPAPGGQDGQRSTEIEAYLSH